MIGRMGPQAAANNIPAGLRPQFDEISAMVEQQECDRLRLVHAMGAFVAEATGDRAPYGKQVVHLAAVGLGTDTSVLYRAQKVHTAFPDWAELDALVERGRKVNYQITATHVAEFSRIADTRERAGLIEGTLRDRLLTRELRKRADQHFPQSTRDLPVLALPRNLRGAVLNIGGMTKNLSEALDRVVPDHLLAPLAALNVELTRPDEFDQITALIDGMEELAATLSGYAGQVSDCLARVRGAGGGDAGAEESDGGGVGGVAGEYDEVEAPEETPPATEVGDVIDPGEVSEPEPPTPPAPPAKRKPGRPRQIVRD